MVLQRIPSPNWSFSILWAMQDITKSNHTHTINSFDPFAFVLGEILKVINILFNVVGDND
jgi:hypothetical protein